MKVYLSSRISLFKAATGHVKYKRPDAFKRRDEENRHPLPCVLYNYISFLDFVILYMPALLFLKEAWWPDSGHFQSTGEKEWQQVVGKLSSQEGVFPFCLNNVYRGRNDGIPTAPGTTAVALWGAATNARGLFGAGKLKCTILARCHQPLPVSAAHECIKTMTCPVSPSKGCCSPSSIPGPTSLG